MMSLADHLRPALWAGSVNAALADHVRFFVPALGANAVACGPGTGLVAAALTAATLTAPQSTPALTASATKVSV